MKKIKGITITETALLGTVVDTNKQPSTYERVELATFQGELEKKLAICNLISSIMNGEYVFASVTSAPKLNYIVDSLNDAKEYLSNFENDDVMDIIYSFYNQVCNNAKKHIHSKYIIAVDRDDCEAEAIGIIPMEKTKTRYIEGLEPDGFVSILDKDKAQIYSYIQAKNIIKQLEKYQFNCRYTLIDVADI